MCLAVPGQVLAINDADPLTRIGQVAFLGVSKQINLALVPEVQVNDFVLVHAGVAITVLDPVEAQRTLDYLDGLNNVTAESGKQL